MHTRADGKLLRIVVAGSASHAGRPRYQAIVERLREEGIAGATVLRGVGGFPVPEPSGRARALGVRTSRPCVIEVVDRAERIDAVMPKLAALLASSVVTVKDVELVDQRLG